MRLTGTLLTLALVVGWFFLFRPQFLGGPAAFVSVNGPSMTPTMHNGDLAIVEKQASYHYGEIIAYHIPAGDPGAGQNVIHRIVGGNGTTGFITKGDHNSYTDHFWHPKTANVIGKVWFHIPQGATWLGKLRDPLTLAIVIGLVSFLIIAWPSKKKTPGAVGSDADDSQADEDEPPAHYKTPVAVTVAGVDDLDSTEGKAPPRHEKGRLRSTPAILSEAVGRPEGAP